MKKSVAPRLVLIAGVAAVLAIIQFATQSLPETDAYYHTKLALLLGSQRPPGVPEFPWLPLTVLDADRFTDHHYLFHVLLSPFVKLALPTGAKWAAVLFATSAFAAFLFCVASNRRALVLSSAAFLAISPAFIYRMSMVRAQSLSLAVLFLLVLALRRNRLFLTLVLCAVYVLLYNAFPLLIVLCGAFWIAQMRSSRVGWWRLPSAVATGLAIGIVVHPNFPANITFLFYHLIDKFQPSGYTVKVGNEWYPYNAVPFLKHVAPSVCCWAVALGIQLKRRKTTDESLALFLFTSVLMVMNLKSRRFVELFPPFALLTLLTVLRDSTTEQHAVLKRTPIFLIVLVSALVGAVVSSRATYNQLSHEEPYSKYQLSSQWLARNSEPLELVVAADWDDFPRLFHYNHHNTYVVGLDPYFLYARSPEVFKAWVNFTQGITNGPPSDFLEHTFSSRFVFVDSQHGKLRHALEADPRMRKVFNTEDSSVYQIIGPRHNSVDDEPETPVPPR